VPKLRAAEIMGLTVFCGRLEICSECGPTLPI